MTLVEWADKYRVLSRESSSEPGTWETSRVEVARGPMLAVTDPRVHTITVVACTQLLKALDIETLIPTEKGFKRMGDVNIGDTLFDEEGKTCQVIAKSEIKYDRTCYEITFSDGTKVVSESGHRWPLEDYTSRKPVSVIVNTNEVFDRFKIGYQNRNRFASQVVGNALVYSQKSLVIHPYVLGAWLGDGHSYSARVSLGQKDADHIRTIFQRHGYSLEVKNSKTKTVLEANIFKQGKTIFPLLKELNLFKTDGNIKRIPDIYLRASIQQRRDLLAGLLDTDGTANNGSVCITSKYEALADDIFDLVAGLGFKPRRRNHEVLYKGEFRTYYDVLFTAYPHETVFYLKRKQKGLFRKRVRPSETKRRRIINVEMVGSRPVQCIAVNSKSHLYLCTKACIPTHNTELINNILGYFIHLDPAPIIVMQPTEKLARAWSQDRLDKMIRDTPVLAEQFGEKKSRESSNTIMHKEFPGGHLTVVGANAPSDLASRPVRIVLCDETDKYPASAGKEGDPIKLISERTTTFWNSLKVHVCSPTIEGRSRIQSEYEVSDQRIYEVPCPHPHCQKKQEMKWVQVKWDEGQPDTAQYYCEHCGEAWTEHQRLSAIQKGQWRATAPFRGHAGFRVNKLVSPWEPIPKIVEKFLDSKRSPEKLKVFVNTQLAETWKEKGDAPEWERLYERRESYKIGTVPKGVLFLTAGVDVQDKRLEVEIVGWGKDKQSWSIQEYIFEGPTSTIGDGIAGEVWRKLDALLSETWTSPDGLDLPISVMAVDSGFQTQTVYNWCRKYPMSRVIAIKGSDRLPMLMNSGNLVDVKKGHRVGRKAFKVFTLGVSILKTELYGWLKLPVPMSDETYPPGFCHFPEYGQEFFQQLTAETLVKKIVNGQAVFHWEKTRDRNEALDRRIYARAAASYYGLDRFRDQHWQQLTSQVVEKSVSLETKTMERTAIKRRPSSFL